MTRNAGLLRSWAVLIAIAALVAMPAHGSRALSVPVNQSLSFQMMGATAAWALDPSLADVSAHNGNVTVFGRAGGRTKIVVISITGESTFDLQVVAPQRSALPVKQTSATQGVAETRYSTAAGELQNSVSITRTGANGRTELAARTVHYAAPQSGRPETSIATASYRLFRRNRELTLLDRDVDHSPLTLRRTPVRGLHYVDDRWRLHLGYTAYTAYQSFLIPAERQLLAGGGYAVRTGSRSTVTPSIFAYRGEGTVVSVLHEYRDADRLVVSSEVGYSGGIGAATELSMTSEHDRVRASLRYRGEDFAAIDGSSPNGFFGDVSWDRDYGRGSSLAFSASATDFAGSSARAAYSDVHHRLSDRVALKGGGSWGSFDGRTAFTAPVGVSLDFTRGGIDAIYRYSRSHANRGGAGFRISGRVSAGRVYASAFVDRQVNAPTLDVIFRERPDLALAIEQLGLSATNPADVARALREHATLMQLGFIEGVTVDFSPVLTQAGLELSLLGSSESQRRLRAQLVHSVSESVSSRRSSTIATVAFSQRLTASTDLYASYSHWQTRTTGQEASVRRFVDVGVRHRFDGLPAVLGGGGTIDGVVFVDEDLDGRSDGQGVVAIVELDGLRTTQTAADGSFSFGNVGGGPHRITARVPHRPPAYFTTPSRVEASAGERVEFGVATTPARLNGTVVSDAGAGIAGIRVLLVRGTQRDIVTTGTDGRFAFNTAPGEAEVSIVTDSVPAGYALDRVTPQRVVLELGAPVVVEIALPAFRSISGTAAPLAEIEARPIGRKVRADEQGRFMLRSLPAGEITLVTGSIERRAVLPSEPASVKIDLVTAAPVPVASAQDGTWVIQIGAYRVYANAVKALEQARKQGVAAVLEASGDLHVVRVGPFASRAEAQASAARLTRAGLEAVVGTL